MCCSLRVSPATSLRSSLVLGGARRRPVSLKAPFMSGPAPPLSLFVAPPGQEPGSGDTQAFSLRWDRLSHERSRLGGNEVRLRRHRYGFSEFWGCPGLVRHDIAPADGTRLHAGSSCRRSLGSLPKITALNALLVGQL